MKNSMFKILIVFCLTSLTACSQNHEPGISKDVEADQISGPIKTEPHRYGGWYCPDNLNGFPAVDIRDWKNVPVVNGRMATKEETQNGTSLIFVDAEKYPNAKPLDMSMPKLATFYNGSSGREEFIIVIQAITVDNDSIVGFRYLNGGNGSARLRDVRFLDANEIERIPASRFVAKDIEIKAAPSEVWDVLTNPENANALQQIIDKGHKLKADWRKTANLNYHYANSGNLTGAFADKLYGNYYIQNDYDQSGFTEKFLLLVVEQTKHTELKIVSGPFGADYESQKDILNNWAQKVKELSENK